MKYIIEFENGDKPFWLAEWEGDPGRTNQVWNARTFESFDEAQHELDETVKKNTHRKLKGKVIPFVYRYRIKTIEGKIYYEEGESLESLNVKYLNRGECIGTSRFLTKEEFDEATNNKMDERLKECKTLKEVEDLITNTSKQSVEEIVKNPIQVSQAIKRICQLVDERLKKTEDVMLYQLSKDKTPEGEHYFSNVKKFLHRTDFKID
jgi:DNA-binding ferritin-like protein